MYFNNLNYKTIALISLVYIICYLINYSIVDTVSASPSSSEPTPSHEISHDRFLGFVYYTNSFCIKIRYDRIEYIIPIALFIYEIDEFINKNKDSGGCPRHTIIKSNDLYQYINLDSTIDSSLFSIKIMTKELQCLKGVDIKDSSNNETVELLFQETKSYLFIELNEHTADSNSKPAIYPLLMDNRMKRILLSMKQHKHEIKILEQNKLLINGKTHVMGSSELLLNFSTNFYYVLKDIDDEEENMKSDNINNGDPRTWINNNNDNEKKNEL